ncbi:MAG: DNA repair protein RecN [uncultured Thermomicrobiales bacterium]|uniref:DNA repair protein RecN n=1 Tax=uncultured Thermomicrobiales bacterium TaxID=1645740 RepID=A0A6J4U821_9BACT|nr:MAG: DNA repair protein RecN [uncultured Thermomicrobiales bacterium]
MLLELAITDFAIIDELRVTFEPGFNALTGETGAGKSILIDALGAVLGDRVGADAVRTGARSARVEATFDVAALLDRPDLAATLDDLGIEPEDGLLIVRREIAAAGRSTARVNGRAATAGMLSRVGARLVDVHGQSDHLSLLRPGEHLEMVDRYAGTLPDREALSGLVRELSGVSARIAEIAGNARERAQRLDLLRFQAAEIAGAALQPGEEDDLLAERSVLANAERLATDAATAYALIAGDDDAFDPGAMPALSALQQASAQLAGIAATDETMAPTAERAAELVVLLQDISTETRVYRDRIEADPARLNAIEDRLDILKGLKRKYGATIEDVIALGAEVQRELESLTGGEAGVEGMRERETALLAEIGRRVTALSAARREAGERLARRVEAAIAELNMGRARFAVSVTQTDAADGAPFTDDRGVQRHVAVDATGADRVEFMIAPNAGEALKPLGRVASGGETARLMLALKSILSAADATPTLVFDEVDVGVGGRSGQVVGEKLWSLAEDHQVLVITHLPQIAAFANAHFRIAKGERAGRVVSDVAAIADDDRVDELAAMLDGLPVTDAARANARAMLDRVGTWKATHATRPEPLAIG